MRWARAAAFAAALAVSTGSATGLTGCSGDDLSVVPVDSTAGAVGAAGGTVTTADGDGVTIPSGALSSTITVTVTGTPNARPPSNATVVGMPYTFGPEGQQFQKPVTVTLGFDPGVLPKGATANDVVIFTAPAGSSNFVPLPTSILNATQASAQTTHFSVFVCAVPVAAQTEEAGAPREEGGVLAPEAGGDATVPADAAPDATLGSNEGGTTFDAGPTGDDADEFDSSSGYSADAAPEPPSAPDAATTAVTTQHNFVIHQMHLGDEIDPVSGKADWYELGYDIDGKVTNAASTDVCTLATDANTKNQTDGANGIDNSFGENIVPVLAALVANPSASQNTAIASGADSLMLDIKGLDESTQSQTASGLQGQLFGVAPFGQGPNGAGAVPTFTLADNWPVDPSFVTTSIADGGALATPVVSNQVFSSAYITNGTFVGMGAEVTLTLSLSGARLVVPVHHATITFATAAAQHAAGGVLSGVILTQDLVNAMQSVAGNISTSLCPGTAAFLQVTTIIEQSADILHDGTNVAGTPCDAISIGIGFTADEIGLPQVAGVVPAPSNPCPLPDAGDGG